MSTSTTSTTATLSVKPRFIHTIHKLNNDPRSLTAAAHTVSNAFDLDPLVTWLRPGAITWGHFTAETMKWQRRRLERARVEGQVVYVSVSMETDSKKDMNRVESEDDIFGGVAILHPPKNSRRKWNFQKLWGLFLLRMRDWLDPAGDEGSNMERVGQMFTAHNQNYAKQASRFHNKPLWYLEVCCARTAVQGRGIGKSLMEWVIEQTKDGACLLECTDEKNVAFYRRFGFEVAEVVVLKDGDDVLHTWLMVKS